MEKIPDGTIRPNAKKIRRNAKSEELGGTEHEVEIPNGRKCEMEAPGGVKLAAPVELLAARLVQGVSLAEAQRERGCSPSTVDAGVNGVVQTVSGRGRFAEALRAVGITTEYLADRIKEGCDATKPVVGRDIDGAAVIVAEVPDHKTRLPYLELAGQATGDLAKDLGPGAGATESYELRVLRYRRDGAGS